MDKNLNKDQLKFKVLTGSKRTISGILVLFVFILIILPFWSSFQDVLTKFVMSVGWYRNIQNVIVPYELKTIASILHLFNFPVRIGNAYLEWTKPNGANEVIYLAWNCVGWQTLILFLITLLSGLSGKHKLSSKIEVFLIGLLGTYILNILRLTLVIVVYYLVGRPFGLIFHDYFSNILTISWLIFFWWFSYKYILEDKIKIMLDK